MSKKQGTELLLPRIVTGNSTLYKMIVQHFIACDFNSNQAKVCLQIRCSNDTEGQGYSWWEMGGAALPIGWKTEVQRSTLYTEVYLSSAKE